MKSDGLGPPCRQCWSLYGKDQLQAAPELLPQHCRGPILPRLSPLLGHSEQPKGLTGARSLRQAGAVHPFQASTAYPGQAGTLCFRLSFVGLDVNFCCTSRSVWGSLP